MSTKLPSVLRGYCQAVVIRLLIIAERFARSRFWRFCRFMAAKDKPYLLCLCDNLVYIVHANDIGVSRKLYIGADSEHQKVIRAIKVLNMNDKKADNHAIDTLVDAGANIGHVSIPILAKGYARRAVLFEPDSMNFCVLKANVALNRMCERTILHNCALGNNDNELLRFELSETNSGDHRVRVTDADGAYRERDRRLIDVKSNTLDRYVTDIFQPGNLRVLIWLDVQGYEGYVMAAAGRTLSLKAHVGMEFWPYGLSRAGCFDRLMESMESFDYFYDLSAPGCPRAPTDRLGCLYKDNASREGYYIDILFAYSD